MLPSARAEAPGTWLERLLASLCCSGRQALPITLACFDAPQEATNGAATNEMAAEHFGNSHDQHSYIRLPSITGLLLSEQSANDTLKQNVKLPRFLLRAGAE